MSRGTRWTGEVPAAWLSIGREVRAKAGLPAINIDAEADKFVDYWSARSGVGGTKLDWLATWRNWCRNARATRDNTMPTAPKPAAGSANAIAIDRCKMRLAGILHDLNPADARIALQAGAITAEQARRLGA